MKKQAKIFIYLIKQLIFYVKRYADIIIYIIMFIILIISAHNFYILDFLINQDTGLIKENISLKESLIEANKENALYKEQISALEKNVKLLNTDFSYLKIDLFNRQEDLLQSISAQHDDLLTSISRESVKLLLTQIFLAIITSSKPPGMGD
jgi:hypothetical protein